MENENNTITTETEQVNEPVQENTNQEEKQTLNESPLGAPTTDVNPQEGVTNPEEKENVTETTLDTSNEIKEKLEKLAEYELKEKETQELRRRLGVGDKVDDFSFSAQRQLNIIENQVQQEYIKLCNMYGVDYRPEKINESATELKNKDPQAFYDLKYKLNELSNGLEAKRTEVNNLIAQRDLAMAMERHKQVFEASPAIGNVVNTLVQEGGVDGTQIDNIVQYGLAVAREAYEMGKLAAANETKAKSPAQILNNNVITQKAPGAPEVHELTLADVEKMDLKTYAKNRQLIDKLFMEGKLK